MMSFEQGMLRLGVVLASLLGNSATKGLLGNEVRGRCTLIEPEAAAGR